MKHGKETPARPSIWSTMWQAVRQERNRQVKRLLNQHRV